MGGPDFVGNPFFAGEVEPCINGQVAASGAYFGQDDERMADAISLVESKRGDDGRWLLDTRHTGKTAVKVEDGEGKPSRWITLRALRVLDWYAAGVG